MELIAGGDVCSELLSDDGFPVYANALTNDGVVGYYESEYRVEAPAVTVTGRGDVGHAVARKTHFTPVVRLLSIRSLHDVDYLANAINQTTIHFESTGVPQLTMPQLESIIVSFPPDVEEERSIGCFICQLDSLITLHQRKCDKPELLIIAHISPSLHLR